MEFKTKAVQQFKHFSKLSCWFALFKFYNEFSTNISELRNLFLSQFEMFALFEKILSQFFRTADFS